MVDDKTKHADDDYQFPHDEYAAADDHSKTTAGSAMHADATAPAMRRPNPLKNKRVVIAIVVVIVAIIFFRVFVSKSPQPAPQPVAQPTIQAAPVEQSPDTADIQSLQATTASKMSTLENQVSDLQNDVNALQESNQQLSGAIAILGTQLRDLSNAVNAMSARPAKKPTIFYHIRALVPDRAWITSNAGDSRSIAVGDTVKGYGKVLSINAQTGVISTSSGRVIEYGKNDH